MVQFGYLSSNLKDYHNDLHCMHFALVLKYVFGTSEFLKVNECL